MNYQGLIKKVKELCAATDTEKHPVVVAELESADGPLNLNPAAATQVAWGGFQPNGDPDISTSGTEITLEASNFCAAHCTASLTFVNSDGPQGGTGNAQRAHPELWLLRNGQRVALAQTYIRDANGQDSDTATISWYDRNPVAGTVYSLEVQRDSIETVASGQAVGTLEVFFDVETANYLQVAAFRTV